MELAAELHSTNPIKVDQKTGQFYVAASRVGLPENIMFAIEPNGDGEFRTANVVFACG